MAKDRGSCAYAHGATWKYPLYGQPMVEAFFGSGGLPYAILYDQLGSFLAISTYVAVVMAIYTSGIFLQNLVQFL